jgi:unsaturated rhamnogalacturonyl hydrolase
MKTLALWLCVAISVANVIASAPAGAGPAPADGATNVPVNVALAWPAVDGATGYDVYFGTGDAPAFQCRVAKPSFVLETLSTGRPYRWRVDAVTAAGPRAGAVQRFTTVATADRDALFAWSIRLANSVRAQYPEPVRLGSWNYTQGMVCDALYAIATRTGRTTDIDFVRQWIDPFITPASTINEKAIPPKYHSLDRLRPGPVLLWLADHTKDPKYLQAARHVAHELDAQPKTSDGGYWHRSTYPNQMWLDGIYMADVFAVQFGVRTSQPRYFDEAVRQITLIHRHTHDPKTGLYYHGWDETKTRPWANKETGTSPEFWGRAIGWYAMAMADVLDWLPADHPGRAKVTPLIRDLCTSLLKFQDRDTAMWYQIIDKPTAPKNYVESSCSLMFAYAMARGAQRGWLPPEFLEHARRAARGVLNHKVDLLPGDRLDLRDTVVVGTLGGQGGFYDSYMKDKLVTNDQKGIGAFMYLSMVFSETANDTGPASREYPRRAP